jgi:hypothetical protein
MNSSAPASSQSGSFGPSSVSSSNNAQAAPASIVPLQGSIESSYTYSEGLALTPVSIRPSASQTGSLAFSIASPEENIDDTDSAIHGTFVEVPIYSFTPGTDASADQSASGEKSSHVNWSMLESERNRVVGHESEELRSQEKSATTEMPVLAKDLHAYRQLRYLCQKVVEMQAAGDLSDLLNMKITRGQNATELTRLRADCEQFLDMNRDTVIRKMQKHKGLK